MGTFRTAEVAIRGVYGPVSKPERIDKDIDDLLKWKESLNGDTIELASIFHERFELIHPFLDYY